jgi:cobalt-zinc-cadmium efflux system membrane fusion protein
MRENILTAGVFVLLIGLFTFAANDWKAPWGGKVDPGKDWCEAHHVTMSTCEVCNPKLARGGTQILKEREPREGECPNTLVRIHLGSDAARKVDIALHSVEARPVAETLGATAETSFPPHRHARVAPRIPGVIREVKVLLGQEVATGAVLAVLDSPEFGHAKGEYLQALSLLKLRRKTFEQEKALLERKITSGREALEAETNFEEARLSVNRAGQRLSALGLSPDQVKAVADTQDTSALMEVTAPFGGSVVDAVAVPGETASPDKPIFGVAAMDRLWISIDVHEADLPKVAKDQRVTFTMEGLPGQKFPGRVVAIAGEVDDRTRTVKVISEVKNLQGLLRARMFGRAEITVKPAEPILLVPKEAVQNDGDCTLVFVTHAPGIFQARKVQVGRAFEGGFEILGGIVAGDKIVTTGSFLLKAEILRGQMGAG